jgi:cystathionine beta-synthase
MQYSENILGLIGNTPLVKINRLAHGIRAQIFAKMENLNPGYSVKDRIGISMIESAERKGQLNPGGTIIEATSGNTGVGLALAATVKGYNCVFVMTDKVSSEKIRYLKALGADVIICPAAAKPDSPEHYVRTAQRIAAETPNSYYPDQYSHPANPEAHYRTTGPELWRQTDGRITHFVSGIGTAGTIIGTSRYLKEQNPAIRVIGCDPFGSIYKTFKDTGQIPEPTPYLVEGIGQATIPGNFQADLVDEVINITDRESFEMSRQLSRVEGIFCGGSTGTNFAGALRIARELDESAVVVFIVCDTGEHYLTKHHSDEWLKEKRLLEPQRITAGLVCETKTKDSPAKLIAALPTDTIAGALALMNENELSQLPVLEEGRSVGSVRESRLLTRLLDNRDLLASAVSEMMEPSFPVVDVDASLSDVTQELHRNPAVLVEEYGRITGIITRHDILDSPAAR